VKPQPANLGEVWYQMSSMGGLIMRDVRIIVGASLLALFPALVYARPEPPQDLKPIEPILEKLKSADPEQRIEAARELLQRTTPEVLARKDPTRSDARPLPPHEIAALVPALVGSFRDPNPVVRRTSVWTLADLGPKARAALSALYELLADEDESVRKGTAWAIGEIGSDPKTAVLPALAKALGDRAASVRWEAAYSIGKIGPEAKTVETALQKATEDAQVSVRVAARMALWRITGEEEQIRLGLAEAAENEKVAGLNAFTWLSSVGTPAVPVLVGELKHRQARIRSLAAYALAEVRPRAKEAVPDLIVALSDSDADVREFAAYGLGQIGLSAQTTVPALKKALSDSEAKVRESAAEALKAIEREGTQKAGIK
jgi:HEAT repeat protein